MADLHRLLFDQSIAGIARRASMEERDWGGGGVLPAGVARAEDMHELQCEVRSCAPPPPHPPQQKGTATPNPPKKN